MSISFFTKKKNQVRSITTGFIPKTVMVPLIQENNTCCIARVSEGDTVSEGQIIAEPEYIFGKPSDSAYIHSPIPGTVTAIKECCLPDGKYGKAIEIKLNGSFSHTGKKKSESEWHSKSPAAITESISRAGVVNTFSHLYTESLASQINRCKTEGDNRLFLRLYDEDPSCQTDSVISKNCTEKIVAALEILTYVLAPQEIVIARGKNAYALDVHFLDRSDENNAEEAKKRFLPAISSRKDLFFKGIPVMFLNMDTTSYPSGNKAFIIEKYRKTAKITSSISSIARTSVFVDSSTMLALYNGIVLNQPQEKATVFVNGDCLKSSAVMNICAGSSFGYLAEQCGIENEKIKKIIVNGLFNGYSVPSLDIPVTKYVKSVFFVSKKEYFDYSTSLCLKCGKCRNVCPLKLCPDIMYDSIVNGIKKYGDVMKAVKLCTQCGLCNTACQARLPLSQSIRLCKDNKDEQ